VALSFLDEPTTNVISLMTNCIRSYFLNKALEDANFFAVCSINL